MVKSRKQEEEERKKRKATRGQSGKSEWELRQNGQSCSKQARRPEMARIGREHSPGEDQAKPKQEFKAKRQLIQGHMSTCEVTQVHLLHH